MVVITAREIVGIVSIVLLIGIIVFGLVVDLVRKQCEKIQKKMWYIGEYDKETNEKNHTVLIGKGDMGGVKND